MRRDYGFAIFAILIVGFGIGASCTIFSVLNAILIRPLPFRDPGRLVWIANHTDDTNNMSGKTVQVNYLLDYRKRNKSFEDLGDRKSTRLNSSHVEISYAVFCLKKKKKK